MIIVAFFIMVACGSTLHVHGVVINDAGDAAKALQPFGASLFAGQASAAPGPDINSPNYHLQPGDRVSLRLYGATNLETVLTVDVRGNAYIPEAGLVHLDGLPGNSGERDAGSI